MDKRTFTLGLFFSAAFLYQVADFNFSVFTWVRLGLALFFLVMSITKIREMIFYILANVFAYAFVGLVSILPTKRASDLRQRRVREEQIRKGASC